MSLTQAQSDFINSNAKFIRLLAPAGCGKTFSIVEKTKKLFADNPKVKIAIFTFTRTAANEIKARCGNDACVSVYTLNSWGNNHIKNILRNPRIVSGKDKKWFVMNSLQPVWLKYEHAGKFETLLTGRSRVRNSEKLLDLIDEFKNIGFKHTEFTKKQDKNQEVYNAHLQFIKRVSLKNYYDLIVREILNLIAKKELLKSDETKHKFIVRHWIPFWKDCCEHMFKTGFYTFDDQKYIPNIDLDKKVTKNQRRSGAAKVDYIFVDEFQDTSPLDISLISNLQQINDCALTIVGDDDQAIYEFRGASPYFILHPEKIFANRFKTFILDENFRSPGNIVDKSMLLIKHNENRVDKDIKSSSKLPHADIRLFEYPAQENMIDAVIDDVKETLNTPDKTVAILSRLKSSLLPYQILLTKERIPYYVSDDLAFFYTAGATNLNKAMEIKQKAIIGSDELVELVSMFCKNELYKEARDTLFRAFRANDAHPETINRILLLLGEKNPRFSKLFVHDFIVDFMAALDKFVKADNVYDTLDVLLNEFGGFQANFSRSLEDIYFRDPPLSSLLNFAEKYGDDFNTFVEDFNRAIDQAICQAEGNDILLDDKIPQITLSTALRVKGQEYDKVIVLDANNGVWPKLMASSDNGEEIESERRLFYVATTRAKEHLHLYRTSQYGDQQAQISPFVIEGQFNKKL